MKPIPLAIVNQFSKFNPTPEDIQSVTALIQQIQKNPDVGNPIPFKQPEYQDCYVAFTADAKWRVVYRIVENDKTGEQEPVIVSIDRQE